MCGLLSIENNLYYPAELIIVNGYLSIRKYTEDWRSHLLSFLLLSIIICCRGEKCEKDIKQGVPKNGPVALLQQQATGPFFWDTL